MASDSDRKAAEEYVKTNITEWDIALGGKGVAKKCFLAGIEHERKKTKAKIDAAIAKIKEVRAQHPALGVVEVIVKEIGDER